MKRLFTGLVFWTASVACSAQVAVTMGAVEYPPYTSAEGGGTGLAFDVLRAALGPGFTVTPVVLPPARAVDEFRRGDLPILAFDGGVSSAASDTIRSVAYLQVNLHFYQGPGGKPIVWEQLSDLRGRSVGVLRVSKYAGVFQEAGIKIEPLNSLDQAFRMLEAGRIDLVFAEDLAAEFLMAKSGSTQGPFRKTNKPVAVFPGALWFNLSTGPGKAAYERFSVGVRSLIRSGQAQVLAEKYFGQGRVPPTLFLADPGP